jgi:hypothetical protein
VNRCTIDVDQFDDDGFADQRPQIDTDLETPHRNHVGLVGPIGVGEPNVLGDDCRAAGKVDQQVAVDHKLAAGLLRDQALDLRLENAEVGRPQPGERQHDSGE